MREKSWQNKVKKAPKIECRFRRRNFDDFLLIIDFNSSKATLFKLERVKTKGLKCVSELCPSTEMASHVSLKESVPFQVAPEKLEAEVNL